MKSIVVALSLLCSCIPSEEEITDECREVAEQAVADAWTQCEAFFERIVLPALDEYIRELEDFIAQECSSP